MSKQDGNLGRNGGENAFKRNFLEGITVIDLTRLLPGGLCTKILSDLGARVIKVEEPSKGDYIREYPPKVNGISVFHHMLNHGKESITINLKKREGREILLKLAEKADIFIEGFKPSTAKKLQITYDEISKVNPRIIHCSLTGYGQSGIYTNIPAHDINLIALTGLLDACRAEGKMAIPSTQIADIAGGLIAALSIILSLYNREKNNEGTYIDVSMMDASMLFALYLIGWCWLQRRHPKTEETPLTGMLPCYNIYETRDDRWITLGLLEREHWIRFCKAIGREDLIAFQFHPKARGKISKEIKLREESYWIKLASNLEICISPIKNIIEAVEDPHIIERKILKRIDNIMLLAYPAIINDIRPLRIGRGPKLGEHTYKILGELGYDVNKIEELKKSKVI